MDFLYDNSDEKITLSAGNRSCRGSSYIQQEFTYPSAPYYFKDQTEHENIDTDNNFDGYIKLHLPFDFLYQKKTVDKLYLSPYGYVLFTSTSPIDMERELEQNPNIERKTPIIPEKNEYETLEEDLDHYYTQYISPFSTKSAPFSASFPPVSTYFIAAHKYDNVIEPDNYKVGINTDNSTYFWIRFEAQIPNPYYDENENIDQNLVQKRLKYLVYEYELLFTVENMLEIRIGSLAFPLIKHYTTGVKDSNRILLENLPVHEEKSFVVIHDIYSVSLYNNYFLNIEEFDQPKVSIYYDIDESNIVTDNTKMNVDSEKKRKEKNGMNAVSLSSSKEKAEEKLNEKDTEISRQYRQLGWKTYPPSPSPTPLPSPFEDCYDFVNNLTPPNNEATQVFYRSCQHKFGDDYRCECEWEVW